MKKIINGITNLYSKYKYALYSSMIFTFITHFYYFTKRLGNEDDLNYLLFSDSALTSGRWSDGTFFSTSLMSPAIKFLLVIIILSICSVLICDIFKIKSKKSMILIPLIISTFPTLALSFSYLFMIEVYLISLLLSILAIWITIKYKYGFILGSICIAISLGHYQSYIACSVSLVIIYLLQQIIKKEKTKELLYNISRLFIMGIIGVLLYFIILNIFLKYFNLILSDYKGANSMGIPPINEWPKQIIRTYRHFIGYFIGLSYYKVSLFETLSRVSLIGLSFIYLIIKIIKEKVYKNKINIIIFIVLLLTLPLTFNIVDFMAYKAELSSLQIFNFSLLYILCIIIIDSLKEKKLITNIIIILLIIIGYLNFISTNTYYYKVEEYYSYTEKLNNRLLTRIESTKEFNYDMPVMFVGNINNNFYNKLYEYPALNDTLTFDQSLWGGKYIGYTDLYTFKNDKKIFKMIENQFGVTLVRANDEQRNIVLSHKDYKNIGAYPEHDSIKIIEGILVVNF